MRGGQLAEGLGHDAGLQSHVGVAHVALQLGPWHQGSHAVDDYHVHRAAAHQVLGDLQRLLGGVRLRNQQFAKVDAEVACVGGIQGVLGVDVGRRAAHYLRLSHDVMRQGGLSRGLGPEYLGHPPARHTADAQRYVQRKGTGGYGRNGKPLPNLTQLHDAALANLALYLAQRQLQGFLSLSGHEISSGSTLGAWLNHSTGPTYGQGSAFTPY